MWDFYRTWFSIKNYEDFFTRAIGIQRGSKGFLYGFYMDFYVESLGNRWESRGCLKGFCRSFYKDVMGISVRILWGFNERISILMSTRIQWYSTGIL